MEKTGQFRTGSAKVKEAAQRATINVRDMLLAQGAKLNNEHSA